MGALGWALIPYNLYLGKKRRKLDTDKHTRRIPYEDEGRECVDSSTHQGIPNVARKPLEAKGKAWKIFFIALGRTNTLILDSLLS